MSEDKFITADVRIAPDRTCCHWRVRPDFVSAFTSCRLILLQHCVVQNPSVLTAYLHSHCRGNDNPTRHHRRFSTWCPTVEHPGRWLQCTCQNLLLVVCHPCLRATHHLRDCNCYVSSHTSSSIERIALWSRGSMGRVVLGQECRCNPKNPRELPVLWLSQCAGQSVAFSRSKPYSQSLCGSFWQKHELPRWLATDGTSHWRVDSVDRYRDLSAQG